MRSHFERVTLFGQHPLVEHLDQGRRLFATGDWRVAAIGTPGGETYTLALASARPVDPREPLVVLGNEFEVRWWNEQVEGLRRALEEAHEAEGGARAQLADASRRLFDLEQRLARLPEMEHQLRQLQADAADVEIHRQIVRDMKASPSWRITAPLRRLKARLRR